MYITSCPSHNFIFQIHKIEQNFLSDIDINMDPDNYIFEFYQKRGRFHINGINIFAIPDNNIFEQTIFKINNLSLDINDFFIQIKKIKDEQNIQNGRGRFTFRNFELKILTALRKSK